MMKNFKKYTTSLLSAFVFFLPMVSFAQTQPSSSGVAPATLGICNLAINPKVGDLFDYATCILSKSIVPFIFGIATVVFIWGVIQYVINTDDEAKRAKGRDFMIWGLIGLTVMVCVWGLVSILGNTFGISNVLPKVVQ